MDHSRPPRILLGVTGGIAAYKSPDLVRRLRELGAEVQVVTSRGAEQFVSPLTFQAVSGRPVRDSLWDAEAEAAMGHIELARWADLVLIAPATAECLARLAQGRADDLMTTLCLATAAPVVVAPAMNHEMWANAATQANVGLLALRGIEAIGPASGDQACGETGPGRMVETAEIARQVMAGLSLACPLAGRRVLVTTGPTRERIDPVRYISNRSSGKMGFAVARAAREAGAAVIVVCGPVSLLPPSGVEVVNVESAREMHEAVMSRLAGIDIFIAAAAVSDYRPVAVMPQKIKKAAGGGGLTLALERNPDILAEVAATTPRPLVVGFAAETERLAEHARAKLEAKRLDMVAANLVGDRLAFDQDDNELLLLWGGGEQHLPRSSKLQQARGLIRQAARLLAARNEK